MRTRIKICCISSAEEAGMAIRAGADALGLVGAMPSGPGPIPDAAIAEIAQTIHPPVASFLLTSEQTATGIIAHLHRVHTNTVQIVDKLVDGDYQLIKKSFPAVRVVQVIHVTGPDSIAEALVAAEGADSLLLDSGNPLAPVKTLGGTGQTHDWAISREIVRAVNVPVFLAGGLHHENVAAAIRQVRPFAVDVCSGVRTAGKLDRRKLHDFIRAVGGVSEVD